MKRSTPLRGLPTKTTTDLPAGPCADCAGMALAHQKLSAQVIHLRNKFDKLLKYLMTEVFEEGDGIDWQKTSDTTDRRE